MHYGRDEKRDYKNKKLGITRKAIVNYNTKIEYSILELLEEEKKKQNYSHNSNEKKIKDNDYVEYISQIKAKINY